MSFISLVQRFAGFQEEIESEIFRRLHQGPDLSQRILAKELGISLGNIYSCFQALVGKGCNKMYRFSQSNHEYKLRLAYLLIPGGLAEKSRRTAVFLKRMVVEYEALQPEVKALKAEMNSMRGGSQ